MNDDDDKLKRQQDFHDRSFWFMLVMMVFLVVNCEGCSSTPLTEDQQYERDNKELLRIEAFERYAASCEAQGARVRITRHSFVPRYCMYITCPPARGDRVECVR